jgi:AraC-like DNA-binding protein
MTKTLKSDSIDDDDLVLIKYRDIYHKYLNDKIIDVDKRMKHQFSFQLYTLENAVPRVNGVVPPSRQTPYWIALFKKGDGEKTIGLHTFPVKNNTLFIVPKRVIHSSTYFSTDCEGYVLLFNIDFFLNNAFPKHLIADRKVFKNSIRPYLYLDDAQMEKLLGLFTSIDNEQSANELEKNEMIAIKILEILINCDRLFTEAEQVGDTAYYHPIIEKFNELLDTNFTREKTVGFYAKALHLHPNSLNFLVKKHTGVTAKQSINNRLLTEGKYLLTHTDDTIKEIANQLGFEEAHNFSTFFRKYTSLSPLAYKAGARTV